MKNKNKKRMAKFEKKMLEKLFTSKNRIKILEYLFFYNKEIYLREIVKELKISPSAVKREIDNLLSIGLINKQKNKIILNEFCNILEDLKKIFLKTDFIIYPITKALKNKKIKFAFLFGSFPRGDYKIDSDIDLMIIGNIPLSSVIRIIKPVEDKIKREINPIVWTLENLKKQKQSGFVKDIFKKKIIIIKGNENELRKIIE